MKSECTRHFTILLVSFTSVHTSHVHDVLGKAYKRRLIARQGDNFREISDQTHTLFFFLPAAQVFLECGRGLVIITHERKKYK